MAETVEIGVAAYPYTKEIFQEAFAGGDLSFQSGDVIREITLNDNGWWEGSLGGSRGTFPSNYVLTKILAKGKITHSYEASRPDEISVNQGDDVDIYERRTSGWFRVISGGKGGLVPGTFVREGPASSPLASPSPVSSPANGNPPLAATFGGDRTSGGNPLSKSMGNVKGTFPKPTTFGNKNVNVPRTTSGPGTAPGGPVPATQGPPPPPATTGPPPPPATTGPPPAPLGVAVKRGGIGGSSPASAPKAVGAPKAAPPPAAVPAGSGPKAKALYAYTAQHAGDLDLVPGAIIELTKTEGGWWEGIVNGTKGIFPANYVERI